MITRPPLPKLMVAPNGARRTKADHPALPITLDEIVATAVACSDAGAEGLHLHIRDQHGAHSLDVDRYRETIARVMDAAPELFIQVTSEAAGRYTAEEQRALIRGLRPASVSVALREMIREPNDRAAAGDLYHWAVSHGVMIQHIVYSPDELAWLMRETDEGTIPGDHHQVQLVLGAYGTTEPPPCGALEAFLSLMSGRDFDWMICAFGPSETPSLTKAARHGGKVRVGFENSLWNADGSIARDNAERVREVREAIEGFHRIAAPQTLSPSDK